jgi:hypothetical protein
VAEENGIPVDRKLSEEEAIFHVDFFHLTEVNRSTARQTLSRGTTVDLSYQPTMVFGSSGQNCSTIHSFRPRG